MDERKRDSDSRENVSGRLPKTAIESAAIQPAISELLRTIPATWAEFDFDTLTELQSDALFLLTAAGMVERRGWLRTTIANHPVCFELRFQATGEGGLINALEHATAVEYEQWRDAWIKWRFGETKDCSPFLVQAMKPQEWRLTSQGELARDDLAEPHPAVFDFVLKRGFFGPGYWTRRPMNGQPLSAEERTTLESHIAAGDDLAQLSRPAVTGFGELLLLRQSEQTNASQAVNLTNWNEGAAAFAQAFAKILGTSIEASSKTPADDVETAVDHGQSFSPKWQADDDGRSESPILFREGELVLLPERVTLCGLDICSGPRSRKKRRLLELLAMKQTNGRFVSYSGEALALLLGGKSSEGTVSGAIRDLRDDISEALLKANVSCSRLDVILSGGLGYRLADCISVQNDSSNAITDIAGIEESENVRNVLNSNVRNVRDGEAERRRNWILHQLGNRVRLKARNVADQFARSLKTAQRDLESLRDEGKVEFVGDPRTGYYQLCQSTDDDA